MAVKQQENGKWLVHIKRDGLPRVRKQFKDRYAAEVFERDYLNQHSNRELLPEKVVDRRTLLELCEIWYRYHGVNLADGQRRLNNVRKMAEGLGNPVAAELTPSNFLDYRYRRTQTDQTILVGKTFNNQHGYLNAVYRKLRKLRVIDYESPIGDVDFIKIQERQTSYLSPAEILELFSALQNDCSNESVWWIAQLCIRTGARWTEAEQIKRRQLHNNRVTFENTKSKRMRTVQISPEFMGQLSGWFGHLNPNQRVFKNGMTAFNRTIRRSKLALPKGQMTHILRHTFGSHFMLNGGNIVALKEILGHADIKMTMKYAHLAPDHSADAVKFNPVSDHKKSGPSRSH